MTPEQEHQLFRSIGEIQGTQTAILQQLTDIKSDLNKRVDGIEQRVTTVEEKVTNTRIKVGTISGVTALAVAIAAELLKLKTGG
ncbi:hypothetical protein [Pseudoalteromonas sp. R3]|uniref:hypothetical protein n=1 Tax=Pseudoalteromonas sp. R3 TaxID=1709477 RepID=UPI0006B523F9|nr:hypothetical protein [Pseudoalteromonas sp. R3]AZZ98283.1 hypothetical protein ELR70_14845 [Pseudoalteromonas sp. R3]